MKKNMISQLQNKKEEDNIKNYLELDDIIMNDILYNINKRIY